MKPSSKNDRDNDSEPVLWDLIKDIRFAMFTTQQTDGQLCSRPMTTQNKDSDETTSLWFFMSRKGDPVQELKTHPQVNVAYADPGKDSYVSASGTAAVVENMAKKEQLWNRMAQAWFADGVSDPDLALVQVEIHNASYWDTKSSKMVQLLAIAKAAVTGNPPNDIGEHGQVRMR